MNRANNPGGRRVFASAWPTRSENISMSDDTMNSRQVYDDRHGHRACHNHTPGLRQGLARLMDGGRWRGGLRRRAAAGLALTAAVLAFGSLGVEDAKAAAKCPDVGATEFLGTAAGIRMNQLLITDQTPDPSANREHCKVEQVPLSQKDIGYYNIRNIQSHRMRIYLPNRLVGQRESRPVRIASGSPFNVICAVGGNTRVATNGFEINLRLNETCNLQIRWERTPGAVIRGILRRVDRGYTLTNAQVTGGDTFGAALTPTTATFVNDTRGRAQITRDNVSDNTTDKKLVYVKVLYSRNSAVDSGSVTLNKIGGTGSWGTAPTCLTKPSIYGVFTCTIPAAELPGTPGQTLVLGARYLDTRTGNQKKYDGSDVATSDRLTLYRVQSTTATFVDGDTASPADKTSQQIRAGRTTAYPVYVRVQPKVNIGRVLLVKANNNWNSGRLNLQCDGPGNNSVFTCNIPVTEFPAPGGSLNLLADYEDIRTAGRVFERSRTAAQFTLTRAAPVAVTTRFVTSGGAAVTGNLPDKNAGDSFTVYVSVEKKGSSPQRLSQTELSNGRITLYDEFNSNTVAIPSSSLTCSEHTFSPSEHGFICTITSGLSGVGQHTLRAEFRKSGFTNAQGDRESKALTITAAASQYTLKIARPTSAIIGDEVRLRATVTAPSSAQNLKVDFGLEQAGFQPGQHFQVTAENTKTQSLNKCEDVPVANVNSELKAQCIVRLLKPLASKQFTAELIDDANETKATATYTLTATKKPVDLVFVAKDAPDSGNDPRQINSLGPGLNEDQKAVEDSDYPVYVQVRQGKVSPIEIITDGSVTVTGTIGGTSIRGITCRNNNRPNTYGVVTCDIPGSSITRAGTDLALTATYTPAQNSDFDSATSSILTVPVLAAPNLTATTATFVASDSSTAEVTNLIIPPAAPPYNVYVRVMAGAQPVNDGTVTLKQTRNLNWRSGRAPACRNINSNGFFICTIDNQFDLPARGGHIRVKADYTDNRGRSSKRYKDSSTNELKLTHLAPTTATFVEGTGSSAAVIQAATVPAKAAPYKVHVKVLFGIEPVNEGTVTLSKTNGNPWVGGSNDLTCNPEQPPNGVFTCTIPEADLPTTASPLEVTATYTDPRTTDKKFEDSTTAQLTLTRAAPAKTDVELKLVESGTSSTELTRNSPDADKATVGFSYDVYVRVQEAAAGNAVVTSGSVSITEIGGTALNSAIRCSALTGGSSVAAGVARCIIPSTQITEAGTLTLKATYTPTGRSNFNAAGPTDLSLPVRAPTTFIAFVDGSGRRINSATATAGTPFTVRVVVQAQTTNRRGGIVIRVPSGAGDVRLSGIGSGPIDCTYERGGVYKCDATAPATGPVTLNATFTGKVGRDTTKDYQNSTTDIDRTTPSGPPLTLTVTPAGNENVELKLVTNDTGATELTGLSPEADKATVGFAHTAYVRVQGQGGSNAAVTTGTVSLRSSAGGISCANSGRVNRNGVATCTIPAARFIEAQTLFLTADYTPAPGTKFNAAGLIDLDLPVKAATTLIEFWDTSQGGGQRSTGATAAAGADFTVSVRVRMTDGRTGTTAVPVPSTAGDVTLSGIGSSSIACTYERARIYNCDAPAPATTGNVTLNAKFTGSSGPDGVQDYLNSETGQGNNGGSLTLTVTRALAATTATFVANDAGTALSSPPGGNPELRRHAGTNYRIYVKVAEQNAPGNAVTGGAVKVTKIANVDKDISCDPLNARGISTCEIPYTDFGSSAGDKAIEVAFAATATHAKATATQTYTVIAPVATPDVEIVSIKRKTPTGQYVVKSGRVTFELTFNQAVEVEAAAYAASDSNRVTVSNGGIFIATNSGLRNGNHVATVGFNINQVATDGDLHLDIIDPKKITAVSDRNKTLTQQSITNLLAPGAGNDNYQIYTIDGTAPTIRTVEFFRVQQGGTVTGPATNTAEPGHNIRMVVTFSEPMRDTPVPTVILPTNNPTQNGFTAVTLSRPSSGDPTKYEGDFTVPSGITPNDYTFTVNANNALDRAGNRATGTPTATLKVAPARQASGVVGTVATFVESDNFGASPLTSPQDNVPANVDYRAYVKVATNPGNSAVTTGTVTLTGAGQGITCNDSSPKNGVFECEVPQDRITRGAQLFLIAQFTGGGGAYSDSPRSSPLILNVVDAPRITKIERWNTTNDQAVTNPLTNAASVTWRVTFDKAVTIGVRAFGVDNAVVANNTGLTYDNASTNSPPYTLDVKATTIDNEEGEVGLTVDPTKISLASNTSIKLSPTMPTGADNQQYTVDRKAPTYKTSPDSVEAGNTITFTMTFDEPMQASPLPRITLDTTARAGGVKVGTVTHGGSNEFTAEITVPTGFGGSSITVTVDANGALDRAGNPAATGTQTAILTVTPAGTGATKPGQDPQLADPSIAVAVDYDLSTTVPDGSPPTLSNTNKRIAVIATVSGTSAVPMLQTDGTVTFTGLPTNANISGTGSCDKVALVATPGKPNEFTASCVFTPSSAPGSAGTYKVTAEFVPAVSTKFNSADDTVDVVLNAGQPTVSKAPQNNRLVLRADPPQGKNPPQREITFDDKTFGAPQAGAGGQLGKITFDVVDKNTGKPPQGKGPGPNNGWSDIPYNQQPAAKALLRRGVYLVTMKITQSAPGGQTGQQGRASAPAPAPQQQFTQDFTLQIVAPAGATVPAPTTGKGKIVVQLDTNGGGDGLQAHAFTATPGLGSLGTGFTLTTTKTRTSDTKDSGDLDPNTYTITAADFAGTDYSLSDVGCVVTGTGGSTGTPTASDRKVEVVLNANDIVTCVFSAAYAPKASVATAEKTRQMVADYLGDRNAMLLANGVNMDSRLSRLRPGGNGRSGQVGGTLSVNLGQSEDATASAFSMNLRTSLPGDVSITDDTITFAVSATRLARSGLFGADIYDDDDVVSGDTGDVVDGAVGPQMRWDVWIEGRLSRFDSGNSKDGTLGVVYLGADYLITPNMLIGLMTQYDWLGKDYDTNGRVKGHGWMVGPYAAARFGEALYLDVQARWGRSSNDITPLGTYTDTFKTTRWYVSGKLSGDFSYGDWTIRPGISVQYLSEKQKAYTDSQGNAIAGQTVSEGDVRVGPRLAYTYGLGDGGALIPWAEFEGVYTFGSKGKFSKGTYASDIHGLSGSVEAGFDWRLPAGAMFSLSGSYDGIGSGSKSYGARARIDIPF